jgi:hypothetical protein
LETRAQTIISKMKNIYQSVENLSQLRAGRLKTLVQSTVHLKSKSTVLQSEEDFKVRAERIKRSGRWQGIPLKNDSHAYLCACYDEWRKAYALAKECGTFYVVSVWNSNDKAREMLLDALQQAKIDAPTDKDVLKTVRIVVRAAFSDKCLCPRCLTPYAPGDKFCSECGSAVEVYGVCPDCGSVIKGDYCSKCGRRVKK